MLKPRIFIIEDNVFTRELIKMKLSLNQKLDVRAFDSVEACMMDNIIKPDLIVLDYYLDSENSQNINGGDALQLFNDRFENIHIVFISGLENITILQEYNRIKSIDFILKNDNIYEELEKLIELKLAS